MNGSAENSVAIGGHDIGKIFHRDGGEVVRALDNISIEVQAGTLAALVGPDGSGKTTFLRIAAGLMTLDSGELKILGVDVGADPQQVQDRIGYMPQRFGLYEDLSVQENLDLYADLHGINPAERRQRYPRLMEMTNLGPFTQRLAGRLSGGMKQKLGLACTLVCAPELLLLDEPTVGVDPLSRRELWAILFQLVNQQGLTVLLSTSYLDEAERCGHVVVMHHGQVLAQGAPGYVSALAAHRAYLADPPAGRKAREFQARLLDQPAIVDAVPEGGRVRFVRATKDDAAAERESLDAKRNCDPMFAGATIRAVPPRFEDGFMVLLLRDQPPRQGVGDMTLTASPAQRHGGPVVQVKDLVRQFGAFTAVDHISFDVERGEIFGLLGPNGAGKTTTFRMLCGLLPASSGALRVAGTDLRRARASARQRIGYVAQKFSLYGQLSVAENIQFFASAYGLRGDRKLERMDWALKQFDLTAFVDLPSGSLPGGFKQRLAMATALLHEPETLFLDEPTSGADPLARREFWRRITALSEQGVTVVVTTHFMEEAEYCDRLAIMAQGQLLAVGPPAQIKEQVRTGGALPTMEEAFIRLIEQGGSPRA